MALTPAQQQSLKAYINSVPELAALPLKKLFATGAGTTADPATMTFEGSISYQDVEAARNI